jgi:glycosyltransferase involved in cell wall biosynthesis
MNIAIVIPAYNEAQTIAATIDDFASAAPECWIIVVDNNSRDETSALAAKALGKLGPRGRLMSEPRQGKSNAIRRAFSEIDADVFVMVDADCTYSASDLGRLMAPVLAGEADMTVGDRHSSGDYARENQRAFHTAGNDGVRKLINLLFNTQLKDILSGYRCFSARFVKNFPILSSGFELETELTLHALEMRFRVQEIPITYRDRPAGSVSKLNTYRDGLRVINAIFAILRYSRPFRFFSAIAAFLFLCGIAIGAAPVVEFYRTGRILHIPSAILATGLMICSLINIAIAVILDMVARESRLAFELRLLNWKRSHHAGDLADDR